MGEQDYNDAGRQGQVGGRDAENDVLDRELDAALAKYAAVEPRPGLEERILANLRSQQTSTADCAWWRWGLAGALAAVVVVAAALAWRSAKPSPPRIVQHPSTIEQSPNPPQMPIVARDDHPAVQHVIRPTRTAGGHRAHPAAMAEANPKLDVFPSPRPLSDQERILESYVNQFRQEAVLIARARSQQEIRDQQEEMRDADADEGQHGNGTTIR
jgi:hypothetical protein